MAYEQHAATTTLLTGSTGIAQYRFVAVNASGQMTWPTAGGVNVVGATISTCSSATTEDARAGSIALVGSIVKIASTASTVSAGDQISCSSRGRVKALGAGDNALGVVIAGSSGAARVLTVAMTMMGTT